MRLSALLHPQRIKCGLAATSKEEALRELVELVASTSEGATSKDIMSALQAREMQGPFSMGKGSAFPHARTENVTEFSIALATMPDGIDFKAPDGVLIRIAVLFRSTHPAPSLTLCFLGGLGTGRKAVLYKNFSNFLIAFA